jgi:hypothetical protein
LPADEVCRYNAGQTRLPEQRADRQQRLQPRRSLGSAQVAPYMRFSLLRR